MYKLTHIDESLMTRFLQLQNQQTGTIDLCFDDSALISDTNFEFMQNGKEYDCKIALLGQLEKKLSSDCVRCKVIDSNIKIGNKIFIMVEIGKDRYYISKNYMDPSWDKKDFAFKFTRKDLIQVDNVLHGDLQN